MSQERERASRRESRESREFVQQEMDNLKQFKRLSIGQLSFVQDPDLPPQQQPVQKGYERKDNTIWVPASVHPEVSPNEWKSFVSSRVSSKRDSAGSRLSQIISDEGDFKDASAVLERKRQSQDQPNKRHSILELSAFEFEQFDMEKPVVKEAGVELRRSGASSRRQRPVLRNRQKLERRASERSNKDDNNRVDLGRNKSLPVRTREQERGPVASAGPHDTTTQATYSELNESPTSHRENESQLISEPQLPSKPPKTKKSLHIEIPQESSWHLENKSGSHHHTRNKTTPGAPTVPEKTDTVSVSPPVFTGTPPPLPQKTLAVPQPGESILPDPELEREEQQLEQEPAREKENKGFWRWKKSTPDAQPTSPTAKTFTNLFKRKKEKGDRQDPTTPTDANAPIPLETSPSPASVGGESIIGGFDSRGAGVTTSPPPTAASGPAIAAPKKKSSHQRSNSQTVSRQEIAQIKSRAMEQRERERDRDKNKDSESDSPQSQSPQLSSATDGSPKSASTDIQLPYAIPAHQVSDRSYVMMYHRFPLHIERAIYRFSHMKLANPRRPLREQVLLSNFMYAYLNLINQGYQQQMEQQQISDSCEDSETGAVPQIEPRRGSRSHKEAKEAEYDYEDQEEEASHVGAGAYGFQDQDYDFEFYQQQQQQQQQQKQQQHHHEETSSSSSSESDLEEMWEARR